MMDELSSIIKNYYNSIKKKKIRDPEEKALEYARIWWNQQSHIYSLYNNTNRRGGGLVCLPELKTLTNVSLLNKDMSLNYITKRALLISDNIVISHYNENKNLFFTYLDSAPNPGIDSLHNWCYLRCPNIVDLGKWLDECKDMILNGDIFYYPDILVSFKRETNSFGSEHWDEEFTLNNTSEIIQNNDIFIDIMPKPIIQSQYLKFVCEVDLPFIDNVDIGLMYKIAQEKSDVVENFKSFLTRKFLDLKACNNKESYNTEIIKLGLDIKDEFRGLSSDMKELKRKSYFNVTSAVIGTVTATLVAVNLGNLDFLKSLIGGSCVGILGIINQINENISQKKKIEKNYTYYFWLLHKK